MTDDLRAFGWAKCSGCVGLGASAATFFPSVSRINLPLVSCGFSFSLLESKLCKGFVKLPNQSGVLVRLAI